MSMFFAIFGCFLTPSKVMHLFIGYVHLWGFAFIQRPRDFRAPGKNDHATRRQGSIPCKCSRVGRLLHSVSFWDSGPNRKAKRSSLRSAHRIGCSHNLHIKHRSSSSMTFTPAEGSSTEDLAVCSGLLWAGKAPSSLAPLERELSSLEDLQLQCTCQARSLRN